MLVSCFFVLLSAAALAYVIISWDEAMVLVPAVNVSCGAAAALGY